MHARRNAIDAPIGNTCAWIHKHVHYIAWCERQSLERHNGFLWIKGKPGAGKSTIMNELKKFHTNNQTRHVLKPAFFFGGKENVLQRTATGMFRSLVYQIVAADSVLLDLLLQLWEDNNPGSNLQDESAAEFHWQTNELKLFLANAFARRVIPPTIFIIDAMDQCEDLVEADIMLSEVREIVHFLDGLMSTAQDNDMILDVCMSSRSWLTMDTRNKCYEIIVDECNHEDLKTYAEIRFSGRKHPEERELSKLIEDIANRSSGIFLWVRLVVEMLLHDIDTGKTIMQLRSRLSSLPKGLESIFRELLVTREISEVDRGLAIKIFQWVIFSNKTLRLREWHHIFPMIQEPTPQSLIEWRPSRSQDDQLIRQIRTLTMGLVDVCGEDFDYSMCNSRVNDSLLYDDVNSSDKGSIEVGAGSLEIDTGETRAIQVIHESVREFFLRDGFATLGNKLTRSETIGRSHLMIIETCLKFLNLGELDGWVEARKLNLAKREKKPGSPVCCIPLLKQ